MLYQAAQSAAQNPKRKDNKNKSANTVKKYYFKIFIKQKIFKLKHNK